MNSSPKNNYLITGRAGSGKSTVSAELIRRGYRAYDADTVPNLCAWRDIETGERQQFNDNRYVDLNQYGWMWSRPVLEQLLHTQGPLFLCGGAHNDLDFDALFERSFVLTIKPDTQIHRLSTRVNNDYGQDPSMHEAIIIDQAKHLRQAKVMGHIVIDADEPVDVVVNTILESIREY